MSIHQITSQKKAVIKPPKQGSFPIDHFDECKEVHDVSLLVFNRTKNCFSLRDESFLIQEYIACLRRNKHDNISCRYLSKQYLICRMEHNLMYPQPLENLGFKGNENEELPSRGYRQIKQRQKDGFVPGERVWAGYALLKTWHPIQFGAAIYHYMKQKYAKIQQLNYSTNEQTDEKHKK